LADVQEERAEAMIVFLVILRVLNSSTVNTAGKEGLFVAFYDSWVYRNQAGIRKKGKGEELHSHHSLSLLQTFLCRHVDLGMVHGEMALRRVANGITNFLFLLFLSFWEDCLMCI
jgi:hypothetical protein